MKNKTLLAMLLTYLAFAPLHAAVQDESQEVGSVQSQGDGDQAEVASSSERPEYPMCLPCPACPSSLDDSTTASSSVVTTLSQVRSWFSAAFATVSGYFVTSEQVAEGEDDLEPSDSDDDSTDDEAATVVDSVDSSEDAATVVADEDSDDSEDVVSDSADSDDLDDDSNEDDSDENVDDLDDA